MEEEEENESLLSEILSAVQRVFAGAFKAWLIILLTLSDLAIIIHLAMQYSLNLLAEHAHMYIAEISSYFW